MSNLNPGKGRFKTNSDRNKQMIKTLQLTNFKCFKDDTIPFKPLTMLSGLNNTGKSTVLQALALVRHSYDERHLPNLKLNTKAEENILFDPENETLGFKLNLDSQQSGSWVWKFSSNSDNLKVVSENVEGIYESNFFRRRFNYLKAERSPVDTIYPTSDQVVIQQKQVGNWGQYAAHYLHQFGEQDICHQKLSHPKSTSLKLKDQVDAWMGEICYGISVKTKLDRKDHVSLRYLLRGRSQTPLDTGFGITNSLPVFVAILSSEPGDLILLEHPVTYLHPKAQSLLGGLICLAASCGIQIIVENDSDHLLNGIRVAVHQGDLNYQDVQLNFFRRMASQIEIVSPILDRNGRIDLWVENFFDQTQNDLWVLLEPAKHNNF